MQPAAPAPSYRLDIADDTFIVADPAAVAAVVADTGSWAGWWPDLRLSVAADRGVQGQQWTVGGAVRGSMEIWLEPWGDGVLVHWHLRAETRKRVRRMDRARARRVVAWKRHVHALKDRLEGDRQPGQPRAAGPVKDTGGSAEIP